MTTRGTVAAGLLADRYRLTERIAAGGMGEVWRADDLLLQRPVAVKLLRPELVDDESSRARLRGEARAAARLSHPGIAAVYDMGAAEEGAWLVLELVESEPLSGVLQREGRLGTARTLDVLGQAAAALQAAHDAGIVHRDVKPGNLLVRPDGVVKVTDFGIASTTGASTLTRTGVILGTAAYLSPEQADGRGATPASDLYALGVVAYECLSGRRPFVADTPVAVLFAHLQSPPPALPPDVPAPVRELVLALLAKDPEQRPTSAAAVADRAAALRARVGREDAHTVVAPCPTSSPTSVPPAPPLPPRPTRALTGSVPPVSSRPAPAPRGVTSRRVQRQAVRATAVVLALLAVVLGGGSLRSDATQVPAIAAGTPLTQATAAVEDAGLVATREDGPSADVAAGLVVSQRPAAGTEVDEGSPVVLLVSSGPAAAEPPAPAPGGAGEPAATAEDEAGQLADPVQTDAGEAGPGGAVPAPQVQTPPDTADVETDEGKDDDDAGSGGDETDKADKAEDDKGGDDKGGDDKSGSDPGKDDKGGDDKGKGGDDKGMGEGAE